ncbi:MAG: MGMT family protein [Pseudodesulfovibrio sp.]|uniref:methylated-DNA--[protein]-cysteine S-methyltransferase n=1 Tax=Pseudodesulfovibrio aespoeensis (strain ATCC 700646 / DSM 10631 / Aspo-2) TaxID=643562 RepID=E6VR30_PSEA9|nr:MULTISPECIES: MGMT family protein [Pseudodesulfovibrio]MBU4192967.1 MGMT family protein [Pseudomonadota bacterium]ADU64114.1 methylated-DNA/protein-cysteine methyltransferase [Pseudodesulfovibrio aespoeensis Aspo-2]MBU4244615.1 MGMT family protein [Pseudomonadota bacterium]MBU4380261.1 MGMT family protein [Pseudomonadota bacterium]MBU4474494.1 MGMT family protein [Pseudomonadota bacterium]
MKECIVADPIALSLTWENGQLVRLNIHWATAVAESPVLSDEAKLLKKALIRYISKLTPEWPNLPLDFSRLTQFHQAVLQALSRVPQGKMCTYGELASAVGNPNAARAIGRAMATNPFPLIYPCHRVIGASGKLTGFSGEGGIKLKEYLLKHEGAL